MKTTFYFKGGIVGEYIVVAKSKEDAFFDLDNYIQQNEIDEDISFWRENSELVVELKLGDIVETEIN